MKKASVFPAAAAIWRDEDGMTLLEILIVMAILGLLATVATLQLTGYLSRAKADTAKLAMKELATAVDLYKIDVGHLPPADTGLKALVEQPVGVENWRGPYLTKRATINDPWGHPYVYRNPGEKSEYEIVSLGSDGRPGGEGEAGDLTYASDR